MCPTRDRVMPGRRSAFENTLALMTHDACLDYQTCSGTSSTMRDAQFGRIHLDGLSPYMANLCPLSTRVELASFRENFGESIGELVETMLWGAIRQRATEHLDGMLSEQQRIDDTIQTAARRQARGFGLWSEMPRLRSGQMKLPLQIASHNVATATR